MTRRHRTRTRALGTVALFASILALSLGAWGPAIAQSRLITGGSESNFGRSTLSGGFMPDPWTTRITSGGNLDVSSMSLASGCRGYVTAQPDYILDYTQARSFLRLYFVGQGDTTLVVNDARGDWHCNDDSFGGLHPTVDISNPPSGQYDIWVGSYRAGENVRGRLHATEMRSRHP
ncbi:MAG TPA: hypothetical protein RMH99_04105 [Sandaracinaceae bacterium LLY-WYZ-13_1]|nr:hypothetical protein [Sandaracinaceae bacterium LLY-WYZ-13_1]